MERLVDSKVDIFGQHRARVSGFAYRMLGSKADAKDVLQDAYLRWHEADTSAVRAGEAWVMTTIKRLCRRVFTDEEIAAPGLAVFEINGWNRLVRAFRPPVGSYEPARVAHSTHG